MKYYYPMAYQYTENGPDILFTIDSTDNFDKAEEQFRIWQEWYKYKLLVRWIDTYDTESNTKDRSARRVDMDLVKELWKDFGDVPVEYPEDRPAYIDEDWGLFNKGTQVMDIWKWFEEAFCLSVAEDLMYGED